MNRRETDRINPLAPTDGAPQSFRLTPTLTVALIDAIHASREASIEVELTDPQGAVLVLSIDQGCDAHLSDATQYAIDFEEELDREPME
jgi:hypothetical protein